MRYQIIHTTEYKYKDVVHQSYSELRLSPNFTPHQECISCKINIFPNTRTMNSRLDFFGNLVHSFSICQPHQQLKIIAESIVELQDNKINFNFENGVSSWIEVANMFQVFDAKLLDIKQFILDSTFVRTTNQIKSFVEPIFISEPILLSAVKKLMNEIYTQFEFKSGATTISTPIEEVMLSRKGVCQDFAHITVACLRSMGLAARYVSGYIETIPPPGIEKLVGADASHAWVSVYIPEYGWVDFDPTNNIFVNNQHITLAVGRDYEDITPVRGVVYSEGEQEMETIVDVNRM
ncbi:MAG: transglutaminase family protein [Cytophagales bacterium]|nr:MAG: transglutaminase family protein [Cytophagales bacterium]